MTAAPSRPSTGQVEVAVHRGPQLPDHLRWQAMSALRAQWPENFTGATRLDRDPFPPEPTTWHVTASEGEILLAGASVLHLTLRHLDREWSVGALGNVLTQAPYRGEGHGRRVLREVNAVLDRGPDDLGLLLCSSDLVPFYAGEGWVELPKGAVLPDGSPVVDVLMARWISPPVHAVAWRFPERTVLVPRAW